MEQARNTHLSETCMRLVNQLVDSFPVRENLDYFALCGASPTCAALPEAAREAFCFVSSFLSVLVDEGLVKADRFEDDRATFFWNVVFTPKGYRRAVSLLEAGTPGQSLGEKELLLALCPPD